MVGVEDATWWSTEDNSKKNMDVKFTEFMANVNQESFAIERLYSMFKTFMGKPIELDYISLSKT